MPVIGSFTFASLIESISGAFGAIVSFTITSVGTVVLPAGSVATAVTLSPSFKPGFGTVHLPSVPTVVVAVVPSGKVTVTFVPSSAIPVIGSLLPASIGSITGIGGGMVSLTVTSVGLEVLPAGSVSTAITIVPSAKPGLVTIHLPLLSTVVVAVVPSG